MTGPKHALLVDDEPNIILSLEFLLKKAGFQVHIARDGNEALAILEHTVPDIVVLDIMMPKMDGYAVCHYIRQQVRLQGTKVVFLSAKSKESDIEKGFAAGADLYITKPFSTRNLMQQVENLLA